MIGLTKFRCRGLRRKKASAAIAFAPERLKARVWHERVKELGKKLGSYEKALNAFVFAGKPMGPCLPAPRRLPPWLSIWLRTKSAFTTGQPFVIDGGWSG